MSLREAAIAYGARMREYARALVDFGPDDALTKDAKRDVDAAFERLEEAARRHCGA